MLHLPGNRSDHSPVYCVLSGLHVNFDVIDSAKQKPRPSWKSATLDQKAMYKICLEDQLGNINIPHSIVSCADVKCNNKEHCDMLDNLAVEVLEAVQITAETCLPYPGGGQGGKVRSNPVPGWRETVKPF